MTDYKKADAVHKTLSLEFAKAAGKLPYSWSTVDKDADGFHIRVGLYRDRTPEETQQMPDTRDGVRVKYVVDPMNLQ